MRGRRAGPYRAPVTDHRPPLADLAGVRYNGPADRRAVTAAQWAAAGVDGVDDVSWAPGDVVPVSALNAAAVDVLAAEPGFTLVAKAADGDA